MDKAATSSRNSAWRLIRAVGVLRGIHSAYSVSRPMRRWNTSGLFATARYYRVAQVLAGLLLAVSTHLGQHLSQDRRRSAAFRLFGLGVSDALLSYRQRRIHNRNFRGKRARHGRHTPADRVHRSPPPRCMQARGRHVRAGGVVSHRSWRHTRESLGPLWFLEHFAIASGTGCRLPRQGQVATAPPGSSRLGRALDQAAELFRPSASGNRPTDAPGGNCPAHHLRRQRARAPGVRRVGLWQDSDGPRAAGARGAAYHASASPRLCRRWSSTWISLITSTGSIAALTSSCASCLW